ncbi:MAG: M6 family metalloprotease domain-containing protein [Clostridia bacterium]|nr:M6 family metalloprotease domain-containing protein [Clostridia bacterium]
MQRTITRTILIIIATLLLSAVILVGVFSKNYEENVVGRLTIYDDDGATVIESKRKSGILKADNDLLSSYDVTNVVIFIYFQGESKSEFLNSIENFDDHFNGDEISLRDYYSRLSYGTFSVNSIFAMENSQFCVYQASNNRSFYEKVTASKGSTRYNAESGLLNSAVQYADDYFDYQGVDLDVNDDGYVDSVSFVVSGSYTNTTEYWGGLIWPHAWQLDDISKVSTPATSSKTLNGIKVNDYTFTFAKNFSLGLVAHEFGHLLGLPDLYRYDTGTTLIPDRNANYMPVGFWDLMHREHTTPQYVTTYLRYKYLNFALGTQIKEITESGTYTLNPTATALQTETLAYKISVSDKESIYIEYRLRSSSPYEKMLPSDGILVYRIILPASYPRRRSCPQRRRPERRWAWFSDIPYCS